LRGGEFAAPIAELFRFVNRLVQVARGDGGERVTVFRFARRDDLAREQRIEDAAEFHPELMLRPLGIELRVVRHFDGARRGEQLAERRKRLVLREAVAVFEVIEIDDVRRAVGRGELHEPHPTAVRIERSGFRVEADDRMLRKFGDRSVKLRGRGDEKIV
jgi:hypothetical protein